jgi:hypothetical protein
MLKTYASPRLTDRGGLRRYTLSAFSGATNEESKATGTKAATGGSNTETLSDTTST